MDLIASLSPHRHAKPQHLVGMDPIPTSTMFPPRGTRAPTSCVVFTIECPRATQRIAVYYNHFSMQLILGITLLILKLGNVGTGGSFLASAPSELGS